MSPLGWITWRNDWGHVGGSFHYGKGHFPNYSKTMMVLHDCSPHVIVGPIGIIDHAIAKNVEIVGKERLFIEQCQDWTKYDR